MGSTTTNKNYPIVSAGDNMRITSVPELASLAEMIDGDITALEANVTGQTQTITDSAAIAAAAQTAANAATLATGNLTARVETLEEESNDAGPLGKITLSTLSSDTTISVPAWYKPDGLGNHTLTLGANFDDGDIIVVSDPKGTLSTTSINITSKTPSTEKVENSDFSVGTLTIDYTPNGIHTIPASWQVRNPVSINPSGWIVNQSSLTMDATASGGGLIEDAILALNRPHRVQIKARKLSGDTEATLVLYVEGNSLDIDDVVVVGANSTVWTEFSADIEPTVSTDLIIENRNGAAVWEFEYIRCQRYIPIRLDATTEGDTLTLDNSGISLVYSLTDQEWQKV